MIEFNTKHPRGNEVVSIFGVIGESGSLVSSIGRVKNRSCINSLIFECQLQLYNISVYYIDNIDDDVLEEMSREIIGM